MKQKLTYLCTLAALLTATACTHDDAPAPGGTTEGTASAAFHIQTRADGTGIGQGQHAWLYLAERLPQLPDDEKLYCDKCYNVSNGAYLIENLTAQWYKMAFICLPEGVEAPEPADNNHEFNDYVIDYSPVLTNQDALNPDKDLAIYRQVIDRWLLPDKTLKEDVTLTRITGQLVLDMGILKDQFPGKVSQIEVTLTGVPQKVYLHDNVDEYPDNAIMTNSLSYQFIISQETWESNDHFRVYLDLLPFDLTDATVEVKHEDETEDGATIEFPLGAGHHGSDDTPKTISVKANIRTTVYFRGMEDNEFEVRYAGFDNLSIDVDGGDWNGWN
ncbi:MAG TPA: hypothetical protein H9814_00555 [Candidatus Bacteroides merdigallinarum]|uniref:Fimbrillin family protein n=1 Tax=Candidatus Bacteroides merdigallinarum TaxID=2838473 RepID=A0A9D2E725_9BACE|nr:hypothetical protein [Candidatus Bacteroides merdigallinarum]